MAAWKATSDFFFPVSCVGCGTPDAELCESCRRQPTWPHNPSMAWREALHGLPVRAALRYEKHWRRVILAWKDHGYFRLAAPLGELLQPIISDIAGAKDVALVPVPSSLRGWLTRGVEPTVLLARSAAKHGPELAWSVQRLLARGRVVQSPQKTRRRRDRMRTPRQFRPRGVVPACPVVIVDDVVTTGHTLESAARVLTRAGCQVIGAAVLAATPGVTGANNQDYAEGTSR